MFPKINSQIEIQN